MDGSVLTERVLSLCLCFAWTAAQERTEDHIWCHQDPHVKAGQEVATVSDTSCHLMSRSSTTLTSPESGGLLAVFSSFTAPLGFGAGLPASHDLVAPTFAGTKGS